MICAGIDAGSRAIKVVLYDTSEGRVCARGIADQGVEQEELALACFEDALASAGIAREDVFSVVATGYGRHAIEFADDATTEITCHARGVSHLHPEARTIVDIGGQDSKIIRLDAKSRVHDFMMNDRCAAGTGRFLEVVSGRLGTSLEDLGGAAERSVHPSAISSMCVVFAETEIIGLLASGAKGDDIAAGVQNSIAARVRAMAGGRIEGPVFFSGGVALVPGMRNALVRELGMDVMVADDPQVTGALGAAILAAERADSQGEV